MMCCGSCEGVVLSLCCTTEVFGSSSSVCGLCLGLGNRSNKKFKMYINFNYAYEEFKTTRKKYNISGSDNYENLKKKEH